MKHLGHPAAILAALSFGACFNRPAASPDETTVSMTVDPSATMGAPGAPGPAAGSPLQVGMELPPADPSPPGGAVPIAAVPAVATVPVAVAPPSGGAALGPRFVLPSATDPSIRDPNDPHVIFVPPGARNGRLLVYMPGTHGKPSNSTRFLSTAARDGYLAIGLSYPDNEPATVCKYDINCFETFRHEIWDGTNVSDKVDVTPTESIKNRLLRLLVYLDRQFPGEGWGAFVAGNDLAYGLIAFGGHSQGGGFAAYIAKYHAVARVLMFSSVVDAADGSPPTPAHWVSSGHVTPIERYFGFAHVSDKFGRKIFVDWPALGLDRLGPPVSVDGQAPPFGNSHQLTTSIYEPDGQHAHTCVLPDHTTPVNGEVPLFQEVWHYMLVH